MDVDVVHPTDGRRDPQARRRLMRQLVVALALTAIAAAALLRSQGLHETAGPGWWLPLLAWAGATIWCNRLVTMVEPLLDATTKRRLGRIRMASFCLLSGAAIVLHGRQASWWVITAVCIAAFAVPMAMASRMAWPRRA